MQLTERFSLALTYACRLHAAQSRTASNVPYVAHLLGVAAIALEHGASEDEAIAALLHDAIEDQGGAAVREGICLRLGASVADIVDGCTDSETIPKPPWRERKEKYLARLGEAGPSVRLVCAADKLHNVRSLVADYRVHGESLWDRFNGGKAGTLWYYREIAAILISTSPQRNALVDELARVVDQLQRMADAAPRK